MTHLLDNIFWHALSGPQAKFAEGDHAARRYAHGFGDRRLRRSTPARLVRTRRVLRAGRTLLHGGLDRCSSRRLANRSRVADVQDDLEADLPAADEASDAVPLNAKHAPQTLELAELTNPGPFGLRTIELGEYFGVFDGPRLIAMAGERSYAGTLREISGVCTHPDFQGRGLAKRLMLKLIRREMLRNETPFLHVMRDNVGAWQLYERMGFRKYREVVVRVISRE